MSQNPEQINKQIQILQEELWDALHYLSSDFCVKCLEIEKTIQKYKTQIENLNQKLNNLNQKESND